VATTLHTLPHFFHIGLHTTHASKKVTSSNSEVLTDTGQFWREPFSKMKSLLSLLLLLGACTAAICGNCLNTTCDRFYNADCRDDHCNDASCSPHFFFRGSNVTNRCYIETCKEKKCSVYRQCEEEIVTLPCPPDGGKCRQLLKSRCVLLPRPMSCSDIKCGQGQICRFRERPNRHSIVRCASMEKQQSCTNLHCSDGHECVEQKLGIKCIPVHPTSPEYITTTLEDDDPTTPTSSGSGSGSQSCDGAVCPASQHCITSTNSSFEGCIPSHVNASCEGLSCPSEAPICNLATHTGFNNLTVASCITQDQVMEYKESRRGFQNSCERECERNGLTCADLCQGDNIPVRLDCTMFNCREAKNMCRRDHVCQDISGVLAEVLLADSICTPSAVMIDVTCDSDISPKCTPGMTCTEYKIAGTVVGSFCDSGVLPQLPCISRSCPGETDVCTENAFDSVSLHSLCVKVEAVAHILALLGQ